MDQSINRTGNSYPYRQKPKLNPYFTLCTKFTLGGLRTKLSKIKFLCEVENIGEYLIGIGVEKYFLSDIPKRILII